MGRKKYELTDETEVISGVILHRIRSLVDIDKHHVKAGDLGGFIEKEWNLSHEGAAWVANDARVCDNARVSDNALIRDLAEVGDNAEVYEDAVICDSSAVYGNAKVCGDTLVSGGIDIEYNAEIHCNADYAVVTGFNPMDQFEPMVFCRCQDGNVCVNDIYFPECGLMTLASFSEAIKREEHGVVRKKNAQARGIDGNAFCRR